MDDIVTTLSRRCFNLQNKSLSRCLAITSLSFSVAIFCGGFYLCQQHEENILDDEDEFDRKIVNGMERTEGLPTKKAKEKRQDKSGKMTAAAEAFMAKQKEEKQKKEREQQGRKEGVLKKEEEEERQKAKRKLEEDQARIQEQKDQDIIRQEQEQAEAEVRRLKGEKVQTI